MTIELAQRDFNQIVENANVKGRIDYSGRGMFGETCVAIVGTIQDLIRLTREVDRYLNTALEIAQDYAGAGIESGIDAPEVASDEEIAALFAFQRALEADLKQDEMGKDLIFYWPGVQVLT